VFWDADNVAFVSSATDPSTEPCSGPVDLAGNSGTLGISLQFSLDAGVPTLVLYFSNVAGSTAGLRNCLFLLVLLPDWTT